MDRKISAWRDCEHSIAFQADVSRQYCQIYGSIKFKFEIRKLENPPDWKYKILTARHRAVNPDGILTVLSADVCFQVGQEILTEVGCIWTK